MQKNAELHLHLRLKQKDDFNFEQRRCTEINDFSAKIEQFKQTIIQSTQQNEVEEQHHQQQLQLLEQVLSLVSLKQTLK